MNELFLIGEISKLFNINSKTLRYYDELDLFKPQLIDNKTGYRYYSSNQFEQLNTINYLKVLGMSLKDIKTHLNKRSIPYITELFEIQKKQNLNKINELLSIQKKIENRIIFLENLKNVEVDKISEDIFPERLVLSLKKNIKNNHDIELSIRELENSNEKNNSVFIGKIGISINEENLKKSSFSEYHELFMIIEEDYFDKTKLRVFPKGKYITISFRGSHEKAPLYYEKLLNYIKEKHYKIIGDSFERTLVDFALTNNPNEYLSEIQIPVENI